jgi:glycosyltransferase involved in cell wall biosynthesis
MNRPLAAGVIAVVLKGYPRLSETFIAQELHALEERGVPLALYSLRHPTDRATHPIHDEIRAPVVYLPEYLYREPVRVLRGWLASRRLPGYRRALATWWRDLSRDLTANRIRRLGQAFVLAAELPANVVALHAHFLHTPASVTRYAALLRGIPWSCSAHAKDIWTTPEWEKREKLEDCAWITTCTEVNAHHLRGLARPGGIVDLNYHGIDTRRFPPPPERESRSDGTDDNRPVRILAVGRAVDKKGFDDLLAALAQLGPALRWRLTHIGGGPMLRDLRALARRLGIEDRIEWRGAQPQEVVLDAYRAADIFALPCRVSDDGDRDGLPNVLLEAQSQKLPCVSTRISGIPELIEHERTGLLVEPRAIPALSDALSRLITDPTLRRRLGESGFARTTRLFSVEAGADRLAARLMVHSGRASDGIVKIAFYAPLKPVDHPIPSGDRQLAQALLEALRVAGHDAFVASQFRSFEGRGDARRQARLAEVGRRLATRSSAALPLPNDDRRCGSPITCTTRRPTSSAPR